MIKGRKLKMSRRLAGCGLVAASVALLVLLGGCELFNQAPVARITVSVLSGASPLAVALDGSESSDPDGLIVGYEWDFGDGETETGANVTHVFVAANPRTFTVMLTVLDNDGARTATTQSIEIVIGGVPDATNPGAPIARFTTDVLIGLIPFTVTFDAADSTAGDGNIIEYDWDFGDGDIIVGQRVTHTYDPEDTEEYMVTLTVWNSEGQFDWTQLKVIAIVPGDVTGDDEPTAELTVSDPDLIFESEERPEIPSLFRVDFDPRGSFADAGHTIEYYLWDFGDGTEQQIEESDLEVMHIYELRSVTRTYVAQLSVFDDQGLENSVSFNITLDDPFGPGDIEED